MTILEISKLSVHFGEEPDCMKCSRTSTSMWLRASL